METKRIYASIPTNIYNQNSDSDILNGLSVKIKTKISLELVSTIFGSIGVLRTILFKQSNRQQALLK